MKKSFRDVLLTQNQEDFCQHYVKTNYLSKAYRLSHPLGNTKDQTIYHRASELAKKPEILARISQLRNEKWVKIALDDDDRIRIAERLLEKAEKAKKYSSCERLLALLNTMIGEAKEKEKRINPERREALRTIAKTSSMVEKLNNLLLFYADCKITRDDYDAVLKSFSLSRDAIIDERLRILESKEMASELGGEKKVTCLPSESLQKSDDISASE